MLNNDPEYRRRVRQKTEEDKRRTERERYETTEDARVEKVIGAVERLVNRRAKR